jgi:hypothetical protein
MFQLAKVATIRLKEIKRVADSINPLIAAVNLYFYLFIHVHPDDG